jgi:class 3 adenylate cyclase
MAFEGETAEWLEAQGAAWLETDGDENIPLPAHCTFGRVPGNTIVLPTPKISRRHAMIHEQDGEFWLVDLGSTNGVQINGERITHPVQLRAGDQIQMPDKLFTFRHASNAKARRAPPLQMQNRQTVADIQLVYCWIMVADLEGFTPLSQRTPAEELAPLVGKWMAECQEILQNQKGVLAKFLGDGFLAYWTARDESPAAIACACREFQELQKVAPLPFRVVLHYGVVSFGGHSPDQGRTMIGSDLNFAFRLEKVAAGLKIPWIISDTAAGRLEGQLTLTSCGPQKVPDFDQPRVCFTLVT